MCISCWCSDIDCPFLPLLSPPLPPPGSHGTRRRAISTDRSARVIEVGGKNARDRAMQPILSSLFHARPLHMQLRGMQDNHVPIQPTVEPTHLRMRVSGAAKMPRPADLRRHNLRVSLPRHPQVRRPGHLQLGSLPLRVSP